MVIAISPLNISNSKSILSFETMGGGSWDVWDRYLAVEGKNAFHIGNVCGTSDFFFEKTDLSNRSISPNKVANELNEGINQLNQDVINTLGLIFPNGKYQVMLLEISPSLVFPGEKSDYFSHEQVELWGIDGLSGVPHSPKTEYYRLATENLNNKVGFYEFLIPLFPYDSLDKDRVEFYRKLIRNGAKPTAVGISVYDIKEPADWEGDKAITSHHCLAHYLIDGHHKVYASVLENKPITLVSFLATEQGASSENDVKELLHGYKGLTNG